MEFTFDLSQTPVIGRRLLNKDKEEKDKESATSLADTSVTGLSGIAAVPSPRRSVSLSPAESNSISGWKRPWMSQVIDSHNSAPFDFVFRGMIGVLTLFIVYRVGCGNVLSTC